MKTKQLNQFLTYEINWSYDSNVKNAHLQFQMIKFEIII